MNSLKISSKIIIFLFIFSLLNIFSSNLMDDITTLNNEPNSAAIPNYHSMIFGGGPFYSGGQPVMNILRESGFTTVMIWSIHIHEDGDLVLNDEKIIEDGVYIGNESWSADLATLKQEPTSVKRIECSVGAWGTPDFENMQTLIERDGIGSDTVLYKNFEVLKNITGADAIDYDDESNYDINATVDFSRMLVDIGYKITLCPYSNTYFWKEVYAQVNEEFPGTVDRVYLQCYAGGGGNQPRWWNDLFDGINVSPGLWCKHGNTCDDGDSPAEVNATMTEMYTDGIDGGFMWLFDDMLRCDQDYTVADYANAINTIFTTRDIPENNRTIAGFTGVQTISLIIVSWIIYIGYTREFQKKQEFRTS